MYLRQNIDSLSQPDLIPIQKELEHTKIYADIEMIRFQNVRVEYDIEDRLYYNINIYAGLGSQGNIGTTTTTPRHLNRPRSLPQNLLMCSHSRQCHSSCCPLYSLMMSGTCLC